MSEEDDEGEEWFSRFDGLVGIGCGGDQKKKKMEEKKKIF